MLPEQYVYLPQDHVHWAVLHCNVFLAGAARRGTAKATRQKPSRRQVDCRAQVAEDIEAPEVPAAPVPTAPTTDNTAVLDKLIAVFESKTPKEWRKLIAHSSQWPQLSEKVFNRCSCSYSREKQAMWAM